MKKLVAFFIMLVVGMALFAVPVTYEHGALSAQNTTRSVSFNVDELAIVTDVQTVQILHCFDLNNQQYDGYCLFKDDYESLVRRQLASIEFATNKQAGIGKTSRKIVPWFCKNG